MQYIEEQNKMFKLMAVVLRLYMCPNLREADISHIGQTEIYANLLEWMFSDICF